jgi:hypothetical protein
VEARHPPNPVVQGLTLNARVACARKNQKQLSAGQRRVCRWSMELISNHRADENSRAQATFV